MGGHEDKSPYPRVFQPTGQAYPGGVFLIKQDNVGSPGTGFPFLRRMIAHADGERGFFVGLDLWKEPPREFPPGQMGNPGIGIRLDLEEAAALWHSLGEFLLSQIEADERHRHYTL